MTTSIFFLVALLTGTASAEPRFAVRKGTHCSTCHVNPTGGGMRNAYGRAVFEVFELPSKKAPNSLNPTVNTKLSLGADLRLAYLTQFDREQVEPTTPPPPAGLFVGLSTPSAFFPMQADIYANADLSEHVNLYLDLGAQGSFEVFGLAHDLPLGTYVKAGFFTPPFGIKLPNHSAATRQPIGFDPTSKDAGVEVGIKQKWLDAQISLQNGESGGSPIDAIAGKAWSGRAAWLHAAKNGKYGLMAGGSVNQNTLIEDLERDNGTLREVVSTELRAGPFAGVSIGKFTWLGEADIRLVADATEPTRRGEPGRSGQFVNYQELTVAAAPGFDATLTYEYMDRDTRTRTEPSDAVHRPGVSVAWFPLPFTEINLIHRVYLAREDREEAGQHEFLAFIHLFY